MGYITDFKIYNSLWIYLLGSNISEKNAGLNSRKAYSGEFVKESVWLVNLALSLFRYGDR